MSNEKGTMLEVTSYEVLGRLPEVLTMNDGRRITDACEPY